MATDVHGISTAPSAMDSAGPGTTEVGLRVHLKLARSLQTSLDTTKLLELFFSHLTQFLSVKGLEYRPTGDGPADFFGSLGTHQCDYRLTCEHTQLGHVTFSRDSRFTRKEQEQLEQLLGILVFPLRNALLHNTFRQMALVDSLTGLGNRTSLDTSLRRELHLAARHQRELSLLAIDLDHFKAINDRHGHSYGDHVLQQVAEAIRLSSRMTDMSFRYGGEEFVILLSNTDREGARTIAERVRAGISDLPLKNGLVITASIGIGTRQRDRTEGAGALFDRADRALYRAKARGRNCIVADDQPATSQVQNQ